ncbi:MAG: hypothetical protein QXW53_01000 [Desulfurococcaceae archaeon]
MLGGAAGGIVTITVATIAMIAIMMAKVLVVIPLKFILPPIP